MPEQALAKREPVLVPDVIASRAEYTQQIEFWKERQFHVLTPTTDFGSLPPQWEIVPAVVRADLNPAMKDIYQDKLFCKDHEFALSGVFLRKIANASGSHIKTVRLDSGTVENYWHYKAIISFKSFVDGQWKTAEGESEYDLRDHSPRVKKMVESAKRNNRDAGKQIDGARMHGAANCESRAINRAIRGAYAIKQVYTVKELEKPFIAFNLRFHPDMNDPMQKAAVLHSAGLGVGMLYGGDSGAALPGSAPSAPSLPAAGGSSQLGTVVNELHDLDDLGEDDDEKPTVKETEPGYLVTRLQGVGDPPTSYLVTLDGGKQLRTSDREIARACLRAKNDKKPLAFDVEAKQDKDGEYLEIIQVRDPGDLKT